MPEIELKLAAAAGDLAAVRRALLGMAGRDKPALRNLTSTYFDTADRLLQRSGLTLRVRKQGNRHIQTVKAEDAAAAMMFERGEWEDTIGGDTPVRDAPNSGAHLPGALDGAALRPVFRTIVRRAVIMVTPDERTEIEGALDEGEIRSAETGRSEPICEVELEAKRGDPTAIYDIGLQLAEIARLRIEIRSKSERGYRLVDGGAGAPQAVSPRAVALDPEMRVEEVMRKFGRDCLETVLRNEAATLAGIAEGVHQMRVAVRRLRAALTLFKHMLPPDQYEHVVTELKWLGGTLGPARNWDVFTSGILAQVDSEIMGGDDYTALVKRAAERRREAHAATAAMLRSPRYTRSMLELSRWLASRGWRAQPVSEGSALLMAPIGRLAPELLARRDRKLKKRAKLFDELDLKQRHRVRIAVKKLRYATDLLGSLFESDEVGTFVRRLKPLQDELGHVNDVRTAGDLAGELSRPVDGPGVERAAGIVLGWHERGLFEHEQKLRKRMRRFKKARPFW
jgi:inorganic triphosphatase YgiF